MENSELIEIAKQAALDAGNKIMEVYTSDNFETELKDDDSPLTRADRAAHEIIEKRLKKSNLPILSEEGKTISYEERSQWPRFWMVDPLDGTKEFINRNGQFTVNIALIEKGKPIMGVIYVPVTQKLYWGEKEKGAQVQTPEGTNVLEQKATPENLEDLKKMVGLNVVASKSHLDPNTQEFIDSLQEAKKVSMGSSLKFMTIAEGEAQVYPRFAPTMEWDTAAAQAILESLGYEVYVYPQMEVMQYNREDLLNPYFIAY